MSSSNASSLIDTGTLVEPRPHAINASSVVGLVHCVRSDHDSDTVLSKEGGLAASARKNAATCIQALWRAIRHVRTAGTAAMELRATCRVRLKLRRLTAIAGRFCTLLAIASHAAVQNGDSGATDAHTRAWFGLRGAASLIVEATLPLVEWCDAVCPVAETIRFLVPEKAPRSLQGKAVEASLVPAIAGVYLRSVPMQAVLTVFWGSTVVVHALVRRVF